MLLFVMISIVVPVYNVEKYLDRCVESILSQTLTDFKLILVDDGSPDNCGEICDRFEEKDNRIHVIHKKNGGLSDARNIGIEWSINNTKCNWITFIDGDDWVHPNYLQSLFESIVNTKNGIAICGFERTSSIKEFLNYQSFSIKEIDTERFYCKMNTNATIVCGKLFRIKDFKDIRFPVGKIHEDEFTTYKILFKYHKIVYIQEPLYFYYINPNSITERGWNPSRLDLLEAIKESIDYFRLNNYKSAYLCRIEMMKKSICIYIDSIIETNNQVYINKFLPRLRKELRKSIRICKKNNLFCFKDDCWAFSLAYPRLIHFYWIFKIVKTKILDLLWKR